MNKLIEVFVMWASGLIAIATMTLITTFIGPFMGAPIGVRLLYLFVAGPILIGLLQRWLWSKA